MALTYPLVKKKWFAKLQFKTYHLNHDAFDSYYQSTRNISLENLSNLTLASLNYAIKPSLQQSQAKTLIMLGGKESQRIKQSATLLKRTLPNSQIKVIPGYRHGQLSFNHPEAYVKQVRNFIQSS